MARNHLTETPEQREIRLAKDRERKRAYRATDKGKAEESERNKRYRESEHGKQVNYELGRKYRASLAPGEAAATLKEWVLANPEKHKAHGQRYYKKSRAADPEKARRESTEKAKKFRARIKTDLSPEEQSAWRKKHNRHLRQWRKEHPEYSKAFNKAYAKTEKGRATCIAAQQRKRARKAKAAGNVTTKQWLDKIAEHGNKCFYCLRPFTKDLLATMDHMIPISRQGRHSPENITPACRSCNSRKHDKTVEEYLAWLSDDIG